MRHVPPPSRAHCLLRANSLPQPRGPPFPLPALEWGLVGGSAVRALGNSPGLGPARVALGPLRGLGPSPPTTQCGERVVTTSCGAKRRTAGTPVSGRRPASGSRRHARIRSGPRDRAPWGEWERLRPRRHRGCCRADRSLPPPCALRDACRHLARGQVDRGHGGGASPPGLLDSGEADHMRYGHAGCARRIWAHRNRPATVAVLAAPGRPVLPGAARTETAMRRSASTGPRGRGARCKIGGPTITRIPACSARWVAWFRRCCSRRTSSECLG